MSHSGSRGANPDRLSGSPIETSILGHARANFRLALKARVSLHAAVAAGFDIHWRHVDSHTRDACNEHADILADRGAAGVYMGL